MDKMHELKSNEGSEPNVDLNFYPDPDPNSTARGNHKTVEKLVEIDNPKSKYYNIELRSFTE